MTTLETTTELDELRAEVQELTQRLNIITGGKEGVLRAREVEVVDERGRPRIVLDTLDGQDGNIELRGVDGSLIWWLCSGGDLGDETAAMVFTHEGDEVLNLSAPWGRPSLLGFGTGKGSF